MEFRNRHMLKREREARKTEIKEERKEERVPKKKHGPQGHKK